MNPLSFLRVSDIELIRLHHMPRGPILIMFLLKLGLSLCHFPAHAVIRKWILLSDPEDKMAGAKVIN